MPLTPLGIRYPASSDQVRVWEDLQELAEDVDNLIDIDRDARDAEWFTYPPAFTGSVSGGSIGNATVTARYTLIGRTVHVLVDVVWGSTTSAGTGSLRVSLPTNARATSPAHIGSGIAIDASPTARHVLAVELDTTAQVIFVAADASSNIVTGALPFTWTTNDVLRFAITYEKATAP